MIKAWRILIVVNRVVKKICPITKLDEITVTYLDPEELVTTQRKTIEGKYERVSRPRKEVRGGLSPEVDCPSQGHPALDLPTSLGTELMKAKKAWCRKTQQVCAMEQILQDLP
jgi:hypothetical protein